jgi:hypothetical protein
MTHKAVCLKNLQRYRKEYDESGEESEEGSRVSEKYSCLRPSQLIYYATSSLFRYGRKSIPKGYSYLYLSEGQFSRALIQDVCAAFNVLMVFIPIPFFWALFDQHATRWIFQAEQMNRRLFGTNTQKIYT